MDDKLIYLKMLKEELQYMEYIKENGIWEEYADSKRRIDRIRQIIKEME